MTQHSTKPPTPILVKPFICPDCQDMGFFRRDLPPGHKEFGKLIPCQNEAHLPDQLKRLSAVSGLKDKELKRRLSDLQVTDDNQVVIEAAREAIDQGHGWLYLWGGPGNAKSEVLKAIVNECNVLDKGPAIYTKFSQIIEYMRDSFAEKKRRDQGAMIDGTYTDRFNRYRDIRVLAIDEMDKVRTTPFVDDFRFDFLDERYTSAIHEKTLTVFAGNSDPKDFPLPIYDRIRDGRFSIVFNPAGSARPHMR